MQPAELFEFVGEVLKSVTPTVIDPERFDDLPPVEDCWGVHKSYVLQLTVLGHLAFFRVNSMVRGPWSGEFNIELMGNFKFFYPFDASEDEEKDKIKSEIFDGVLELLDPWMLTDLKATNPRLLNQERN